MQRSRLVPQNHSGSCPLKQSNLIGWFSSLTLWTIWSLKNKNCFSFSYKKTSYILHYLIHPLTVLSDSLCDPPCLEGETCNEISGKCVCHPTRRDEEICRRRQGIPIFNVPDKTKCIANLNLARAYVKHFQFLFSLNIPTRPLKS